MDVLYGINSHFTTLDDDHKSELDAEADRLARLARTGKLPPIDEATAKRSIHTVLKAVKKGFKRDFGSISPNEPDWGMLENLEHNVYQFGCAKNMEEMQQITRLLKDVPAAQFKAKVKELHRVFNDKWLETERITAEAGANHAARWNEYQETKDLLPNLTYDAVNDERTRDEHAGLDGTTKPIDDPFWDTYYPPNGWRCRCGVQASDNDVTAVTPKVTMTKMFKTNLAKKGLVFPEKHPYYVGKKDVAKVAEGLQRKEQRKQVWAEIRKLRGENVKHPELGKIGFNRNGLEDAINKPHPNIIHKNNLLYQLPQLIKESKVVGEAIDIKSNSMVEKYFYLEVPDQKDGYKYYLNIRQMKGEKGKEGVKVFYSITKSIKE